MDYASAGVDIHAGDEASRRAYSAAKTTFESRNGRLGEPLKMDGGFAGVLDFGAYYLVQNDDGTGTKAEIAERTGRYETLGYDLCAMVADDAVCLGAEVISLTNTFDVPRVDPDAIGAMAEGLAKACQEQQIVIPGGEIAEMGSAVNRVIWNATAVGLVRKEQFISGETVAAGDVIIGLKGRVLRSNGVSLARAVAEKSFGEKWHEAPYSAEKTWGEVLLTPSKIYHRLLLDTILGDTKTPRKHAVKALCHITGGGIPGNANRVLPKGLGAHFPSLHTPHDALVKLRALGNIDDAECYRTWHSGTAMMLIVSESEAESILNAINTADPEAVAQVVGRVTDAPQITLNSKYSDQFLTFSIA